MNEEIMKEEVMEQETVTEETVEEQAQEVVEPKTENKKKAKGGMATAALILAIISVVTMLFVVNYIFGLIALILAIIYLAKKGERKVRAIIALVLALISIVGSTVIWYSVYHYFTTTDVNTMMEDLKTVTGGQVDLKDTMDATFKRYLGEDFEMEQLEAFVGGSISYETVTNFIGDATEEEITEFINNFDYYAIEKDLGVGFTYEDLVEKLGEDFNFYDLKEYMESLQ